MNALSAQSVPGCNRATVYSSIGPVLVIFFWTGDAAVGKTAIAQVFSSDNTEFPKVYTMVSLFVVFYQ